jgi:hypothetical protein
VLVVNFAYKLNRDIRRAGQINRALDLIAAGPPAGALSRQDALALMRSLARIRDRLQAGNPYRPLTIHRYHPRDDLGGDLGFMNLDPGRIAAVIERGYTDTLTHDCGESECIIPGRPPAPPRPTTAETAAVPVSPVEVRESRR